MQIKIEYTLPELQRPSGKPTKDEIGMSVLGTVRRHEFPMSIL